MDTCGPKETGRDLFSSAGWYDRSINWSARLGREIPVLREVFGPPGKTGLVDAGCGTGRQARALAKEGYHVVGVDAGEEMLEIARQAEAQAAQSVRFVQCRYDQLSERIGGDYDGLYCLGNALAAAGSRQGVKQAITQFGLCLRSGGRLFLQVLNFPPMRSESPCVRGPRISTVGNREYVSVRQFHFAGNNAQVTNITLWHDDGWKQRAHCGTLYPVTLDELRTWCPSAGLRIDHEWGGYNRAAYDPDQSIDLILVATKT